MGSAIHFISPRLARALVLLLGLLAVTAALASAICDLEQAMVEIGQEHCCASLDAAGPVPQPVASSSELRPTFWVPAVVCLPECRATAWSAAEFPPDPPPLSLAFHVRSSRILT